MRCEAIKGTSTVGSKADVHRAAVREQGCRDCVARKTAQLHARGIPAFINGDNVMVQFSGKSAEHERHVGTGRGRHQPVTVHVIAVRACAIRDDRAVVENGSGAETI